MEETGMEIANVRFGAVTNDIFRDEAKHYVTIWLVSDWKANTPEIREPEKCLALKWCNFKSLPEPLFLPWAQLKSSEFFTALVAGA